MTPNKHTVERYIEGFNHSDHAQILACVTDDVIWEMPGVFHLVGKEAFDKEIENPEFVGSPIVTIKRLIEEGDVVVAELDVHATKRDGGTLDAVFCDVFVMRDSKISRLTSYFGALG